MPRAAPVTQRRSRVFPGASSTLVPSRSSIPGRSQASRQGRYRRLGRGLSSSTHATISNFSGGISNSGLIAAHSVGIFVGGNRETASPRYRPSPAASATPGRIVANTGIKVDSHVQHFTSGAIFNSGTITGSGGTAVSIGLGGVTFELGPGYAITGNVVGNGSDTFALGGTGSGSFNLSSIGASAQYRGFNTYQVVGGTWTPSGSYIAALQRQRRHAHGRRHVWRCDRQQRRHAGRHRRHRLHRLRSPTAASWSRAIPARPAARSASPAMSSFTLRRRLLGNDQQCERKRDLDQRHGDTRRRHRHYRRRLDNFDRHHLYARACRHGRRHLQSDRYLRPDDGHAELCRRRRRPLVRQSLLQRAVPAHQFRQRPRHLRHQAPALPAM